MVKLHFHYREIQDEDFTGVLVEIEENGAIIERFANFRLEEIDGEIWGNQSESFELVELNQARAFLLSSGRYHSLNQLA